MKSTSFHSYVTARQLAGFVGNETLLPAFASSTLKIYPYQIAAARFALRSDYLKGCILCDEGSLGKTYEALLITAQKWYEGKDRLLLILPQNLVFQWVNKIENAFTLPYFICKNVEQLDNSDGITIVTYDFVIKNAEVIENIPWGLIIFDEADYLFKSENKTVKILKKATGSSFKLLLTPTPITMSVMDIYGLIHFIDESILPDSEEFYKRYFRKPENYKELTSWISQYAFRTLKSQVTEYINFTERLPLTLSYELTTEEKILYEKIKAYLSLHKKTAYPQMDKYELTLMFYHTLSSSTQAFANMLDAPLSRTEGDEYEQLAELQHIAVNIKTSSKTQKLLETLKPIFALFKKKKISEKAIIFVNNLKTLATLNTLLIENGYNTLKYSAIDTQNGDVLIKFKSDKTAQILIATDTAAKGLDIEFCSVVINYDMLYNAIEMEQRISRCHRQGQKSDVLVINLLSKENFADVRILELINKRVLQFDGIFGMSDPIVGNFDVSIDKILCEMRSLNEIEEVFEKNLIHNKNENKKLVATTENVLFTTFTRAIADKISVTPQYIEDKIATLNADLWGVVKFYLSTYNDYKIDETSKTITLEADEPPILFYYFTGSRNRPYKGQKNYGLGQNFKPNNGRITLTSILAKGIFEEISCADSGEIVVDVKIESCEIGFYRIDIISNKTQVASYDILIGITETGQTLTDGECREILKLPVVSCSENGKSTSYWLRNVTGKSKKHNLDNFVSTKEIIKKYKEKNYSSELEEIERINLRKNRKKIALERTLDNIRGQINNAKQELILESGDRLKELLIGKNLKLLEKDLRMKESALFFEQMKIDVEAEEEIEIISSKEKYVTHMQRHFIIKIFGGKI